jgi:hypothetical protein
VGKCKRENAFASMAKDNECMIGEKSSQRFAHWGEYASKVCFSNVGFGFVCPRMGK